MGTPGDSAARPAIRRAGRFRGGAVSRWRSRERGVGWSIIAIPPSPPDLALLVALNRAAVFGVAARWVLHDLRSPAQSLTLMADLVADPAADLEGILRDSCAHLARSLDLLSRVVHQPRAGETGAISVRESLALVADLQRAGRTSARLEVTADPGLAPAAGIQRHLEHALLALVIHGLDRLRTRETAAIRISARQDRERVEIMVGDSGEVVPAEGQARLFELPRGVDPAQHPLAVSLVAAREVIRLSGGTLTYVAVSEGESGFLISLPVWQG